MLSFELRPEKTKKLQEIQAILIEKGIEVDGFSEEKKNFIKQQSLISNIGASTRIENAILTNVEIDWVDTQLSSDIETSFKDKESFIKSKLSKDKQRSIEEVAGYRDAIRIIYTVPASKNKISESDIKGLHRELMQYYPKASHYCGKYKTQMNNVVETNRMTGSTKNILVTADPGVITQTSMRDLVEWYNRAIQEVSWAIPVAVEFVFRFLAIHPFQDGNGRLSRLLFQYILLNSEDKYLAKLVPYIAIDRNIEIKKAEYYQRLRQCSQGIFSVDPKAYKYEHFLLFMLETVKESIENLDFYSNKYENFISLSQTDITIMDCFKQSPEKNLQTKDILKQTHFPRRTAIYALTKLVNLQFLQKVGKGAGVRYKLVF